jgi:hypothetical protein
MKAGRPIHRPLMLAGSMASIGFFVWPSAALTYPLVLVELTRLLREEYSMRKSPANALRCAGAFAIGGVGAMLLALAPIWYLLKTVVHDIPPVLGASQPPSSFSTAQAVTTTLKLSQFLIIGALVGLVCGRGRLVAAAMLFTFAIVFGTRLDLNRLIYLLPYAAVMIGGAYQVPLSNEARTRRWVAHAGLSVLLVATIGLTLVVRPAIALSQQEGRDPDILFKLGRDSVGDGPHRVYLGAWEFYYAGRQLGWNMFHEYVNPSLTDSNLLSRVDHAILHREEVDDELAAGLSTAGLRLQKVLMNDHQADAGLLQRFHIGAKTFGPYLLYSRENATPGGDP